MTGEPLSILLVAAEVAPFAKTGGLADVAGTLAREMAARSHDVRVVMPRYYVVNRHRWGLRPAGDPLGVPMGVLGEQGCAVLEGRLPDSPVPVYFLEHEKYYGRDGLYTTAYGDGYADNDHRFVFLSRAALQLCRRLAWRPDIIHVNDWHTAAIPLFLNTLYRQDPLLGEAATLLTIHNLQHQGVFHEGLMDVLDVGREHFHWRELEWFAQVNLLKGGIYHATAINTVSEGYRREIMTPGYGHSLDGVLRDRANDLFAVLNGIDETEWDPRTDPHLPARYSADDLSGKAVCKEALQQQFRLPRNPRVPLIGVISRLVWQKGIDILAAAIHRILALDVQLVLLGTGEPWAHFYFGDIRAEYPRRFGCGIGFDNAMAHQIEAGADFFLMPSRFEPCGLNQMYSMRYGTIPIVRATGGLDDTVQNFDEATGHGSGFKFYDLTPDALFDTIGWAVHNWYHRREALRTMRRRIMSLRFSWAESARLYEQIYRLAIERRTGQHMG
ncbi:MAG: glycogen synthase GlgA [Acidobacteria bacterium]|nr:glycogen synthase GlgA [Acidobacteriota bacterium]